jgi:hypothetical protein
VVLFSGIAWAADRKPRQTRGRATEVIIELTETGKTLKAKSAQMLNALRAGETPIEETARFT